MSERIKVTYMSLTTNESSIIATLGMHIISMDLYLAKIKLVRRKDGGLYLAPPSEKYTSQRTGKDEYSNFFWFGDKTSDFFQQEGFKAITAYCDLKKIHDPTGGQKPASKFQQGTVFDG